MTTRTRTPRGPAFAMPTACEVAVFEPVRLSAYYTRLMPKPGCPGVFLAVPTRADICREPGCDEEMAPCSFDGLSYRSCPNPEHPDTLAESADARAGQLDQDAPAAYDVEGRL